MRKIIAIFAFAALLLSVGACKKNANAAAQEALVSLVNQVNAQPDKELKDGTTFTGCEYQPGDSVLTYVISVKDNRFDTADTDSIKNSFAKTVNSASMSKVVKALVKAGVGLNYRIETDNGNQNIVFTAAELEATSKAPAQK